MKISKFLSCSLLCSTLGFSAQSGAAMHQNLFFKPYLGIDAGVQNLDWEGGYGDFHFRQHYPVANFHIGAMVHKYVGFEVGYERMFERERQQFYGETAGLPILGFTQSVDDGSQRTFLSRASANGYHANLVLKFPICPTTDIFATLGFNWAKLRLSTLKIADGNASNPPVFWQSSRKAIPRLGIGIRHNFLPNLGGRIIYVYEKTDELETSVYPGLIYTASTNASASSSRFTARPKNSHLVMAGLYYQVNFS